MELHVGSPQQPRRGERSDQTNWSMRDCSSARSSDGLTDPVAVAVLGGAVRSQPSSVWKFSAWRYHHSALHPYLITPIRGCRLLGTSTSIRWNSSSRFLEHTYPLTRRPPPQHEDCQLFLCS